MMTGENFKIGLVGRVDPGVSAVFQIIIYQMLNVRQITPSIRRVASKNTVVLQCAVYSRDLLENGWQPFEQPSPFAYVPLAYSDLTERVLPKFGAVLIDPRPRRGEFQTYLSEEDSSRIASFDLDRSTVRDALSAICRAVGLTTSDASVMVKAVDRPVALVTKAA